MRRAVLSFLALGLTACAGGLGGPPDVPLTTVALRVDAQATPEAAAAALREAGADVALVVGARERGWFTSVASAARLELSGPGYADDLGLAFMALEAVGDTTIELDYEGGSFTLQDALYELAGRQHLDLLAFRVDRAEAARPLINALMRYVATDVMPAAAVVMAVAVPNETVGDSVARMLSPGYFDALRCGGAGGADETRRDLRLFYGPEARIRCGAAETETLPIGSRIQASLVVGTP